MAKAKARVRSGLRQERERGLTVQRYRCYRQPRLEKSQRVPAVLG